MRNPQLDSDLNSFRFESQRLVSRLGMDASLGDEDAFARTLGQIETASKALKDKVLSRAKKDKDKDKKPR